MDLWLQQRIVVRYMQSVNAVVFDKSGTLTDVDSLDAASPQMITSKATAGISVQDPFLINELASLVHATEGFVQVWKYYRRSHLHMAIEPFYQMVL